MGAALLVVGAKLALISNAGSDQPVADQWAAEGGGVIRTGLLGLWQFAHFFAPHGEHTPTIMRIVTGATTCLNSGQWDSRAEMLVSVGVLGLAVLLLWQIASAGLPGRWRVVALAGVALLLGMPCNRENYLWGFQTPFVSIIAFGLAHLWGTLRAERGDASWWTAQVAGCVAIFTVASGMLSAFVLAGYAALRLCREPRFRLGWATLAANAVILGLGVWVLTHSFFAVGRTNGAPVAFASALGVLLSWPFESSVWLFLLQAPALVFFWRERRNWADRAVRLLAGLQIWCWALASAFAWGRGAVSGQIAGRYQDHLTLGLASQLLIVVFLVARGGGLRVKVFAVLWVGTLTLGIFQINRPALIASGLAAHRDFFTHQTAAVSGCLASNDPTALSRDPRVRNYLPHLDQTIGVLMDPLMRTALPSSMADTLPVQVDRRASAPAAKFRPVAEPTPNRAFELLLAGGAYGQVFVSEPVADDRLPVWRMRVSGKFGDGAARLAVRSADGRETLPLDAAFDTRDGWKTVHLLRPAGPVRLELHVPAGATVRITEPVPLGWLSWGVPKIARTWPWLVALGAVLLVAAATLPIRRRFVTRAS